jgi:hypothetical protein
MTLIAKLLDLLPPFTAQAKFLILSDLGFFFSPSGRLPPSQLSCMVPHALLILSRPLSCRLTFFACVIRSPLAVGPLIRLQTAVGNAALRMFLPTKAPVLSMGNLVAHCLLRMQLLCPPLLFLQGASALMRSDFSLNTQLWECSGSSVPLRYM